MSFCPDCGLENPDGDGRCSLCELADEVMTDPSVTLVDVGDEPVDLLPPRSILDPGLSPAAFRDELRHGPPAEG